MDEQKDSAGGSSRVVGRWAALAALAVAIVGAAVFLGPRLFPSPKPEPGDTSRGSRPKVPAPSASGDALKPPTPAAPSAPGDALKPPAEAQKGEATPGAPEAPVDSVTSQMVEVSARPVVALKGQAKWDDAAKELAAAIAKVNAALTKAGLVANGRPLTVFTETDDNGFRYEAMIPIERAPEGKPKLPDGVEIAASPAGKALKFQHRGTYDEIDSTYEAITAYLDEKGLDTKNVFIEEYLTDLKPDDDGALEVDVYVFVK
jgi:effector-binding domain-containing protein